MSGKDLVVAFLTALEQRDLAKASAFMAPGTIMTFPGNNKFKSLEELVAWSKGRYKFVRKTYQHFDETERSGVITVYCLGVLNGEALDGSPIANVRFLDRFDVMGGKIVDQEVWNDLAEFKKMIEALARIVDAPGLLTGADIGPRYLNTRGHGVAGTPLCVLRPKTTDEVSEILKLCHARGQAVVPQGGMSGLVGGGVPLGGEVVLSLERMNQIEEFDAAGRTLTAQSGVILQTAHEYCEERGFMLPLDLGARGSATIGGVISTNAGGVRVIRYGMMRESVLGLEAVLADGTVLSSMNKMLKNNAGYDLKHLFIGSEGTLEIVTRAVCRMRAKPKSVNTAFAGIEKFEDVVAFLGYLESTLGGELGSFEVMWSAYDQFVRNHCPSLRPPLKAGLGFYVLLETLGNSSETDVAKLEEVLSDAMEKGLVADAAVAQSEQQRAAFWSIRENAVEGFKVLGPMFTYDVSMPIAAMGDFGNRIAASISGAYPGSTTLVLGHMGDGNLHVVAAVGTRADDAHKKVNDIIYSVIRDLGGSVSAEHGIGTEKKAYLSWSRTSEEIALMRTLKHALDPNGILNPGKVL